MNRPASSFEARLGIDFGGVIIPWRLNSQQHDPYRDQPFIIRPPHVHALDCIRQLVGLLGGKVWIVSRWGGKHRDKANQWLEHHQFFVSTGMSPGHVHFCQEIHQKSTICQQLGITHFIDDHMQVMEVLRSAVPHLYLFGENGRHHTATGWTVCVANWEDAYAAILNDL